jgi:hypothetical protein
VTKILLLLAIFLGLLWYDLQQFLLNRQPNLYEMIDVHRGATSIEIGEACDRYTLKIDQTQAQIDEGFKTAEDMPKLTKEQVEDVKMILMHEEYRDIYDKTGQAQTREEAGERKGPVPMAVRYMQAIGNSL